ncbi:MAG TPA: folate-binding protein [Burkholderiaceae bacterium]|nr:folate-binding protein [Burkholderiaceae bacterium]
MQSLTEQGKNPDAAPAPETDFIAPLTDLGLIALAGDDAAHFLHNQITNDVERLTPTEARLAGYCTPKGRLLATFLMWKSTDGIMLQLPHEIQPAIQKRLQMFVLRAKAKLSDATDSHVVLGLAGARAAAALSPWFPALPASPYTVVHADAGTLIRVADAGNSPRYQWITVQDVAEKAWPELAAALQPTDASAWRLSDIRAGIPRITQATQEQFVPQMINFELIGGVNFKKGCYPGQEIVARSQYLGKLKRRMFLALIAGQDARPGMEVFSAADPEQPCGMVVNAERTSQNESACLVEMKITAVDAGTVHLGSATGAALQFQPLPYPVTDPV